MAINQLAAALVLTVLSGSVLANAPTATTSASSVSSASSPKTRAQVIAELEQARANGELNVGDADYPYQQKFVSTKTRAEVVAELVRARASGELSVGDAAYPHLPAFVSTKTSAQVQAELVEYNKHPDPQGLYRGY